MTKGQIKWSVIIPVATTLLSGMSYAIQQLMEIRERLQKIEAIPVAGLTDRLRVVEIESIKQERLTAVWNKISDIDHRLNRLEDK